MLRIACYDESFVVERVLEKERVGEAVRGTEFDPVTLTGTKRPSGLVRVMA